MNVFASPPEDARRILENFDGIIRTNLPLSSKQLLLLPRNIKELSHCLTDERSKRRLGYMNDNVMLSAYAYYFLWWNLFRLTSVFSALDENVFSFLHDESVCLDIGSGPLSVPLALYLARPELRAVKLTWYCMDTSQNALALGENLLLSCAARLQNAQHAQSAESVEDAAGFCWRIVRVKGEIGTQIKQKASFITCANMFNELYWNTSQPLEAEAKKYAARLFSYGAQKPDGKSECAFFVAEPGIPRASRFISLLRAAMLRKNMSCVSPCPHENECPMDGKKGGKWCHFILDTETAPFALKKLSEKAGLAKERAAISFIFTRPEALSRNPKAEHAEKRDADGKTAAADKIPYRMRICSDPIALPEHKTGRYACAPWGLTLVIEKNVREKRLASGDLTEAPLKAADIQSLSIDYKSGAKIVRL